MQIRVEYVVAVIHADWSEKQMAENPYIGTKKYEVMERAIISMTPEMMARFEYPRA